MRMSGRSTLAFEHLRGQLSRAFRVLLAANDLRHLSIIRKTAKGSFRKHEITIDDDLEDPVRALDQLRRCLKLSVQFGRQPGGPWLVVSDDAVFDRDIHRASSLVPRILADPARARARFRFRAREAAKRSETSFKATSMVTLDEASVVHRS